MKQASRHALQRIAALALSVCVLFGLTACNDDETPPDLDTDGVIVITNARANVPTPQLSPITETLIGEALKAKLPVVVISADGTPAPVDLAIPGVDGCNNRSACAKRLSEALGYVAMAITAKPDADGANAYGAFAVARDAAQSLRLTSPTLICLECGIDTLGALSMTGEGRLGADVEAHLEYLTSTGQLVTFDGFDSVHIILTSTGLTSAPQEPLSPSDITRLAGVWSDALTAGGAIVTVDPNPVGGEPIDTEYTVEPVVVPPPPTPPTPPTLGPTSACTPVELSFDGASDARFQPETDSWVDIDAARQALRPTADWLKQAPTRTARILGTTADILSGDPGEGIELSTRRAQAAAALLVELGVPQSQIVDVAGLGPNYPGKVADRDADGEPIPALRTKNRKVIVEIAESC